MTKEKRMRKKRNPVRAVIFLLSALIFSVVLLIMIIKAVFRGTTSVLPDPGEYIIPNISVTFSKLDRNKFSKEKGLIKYTDEGSNALTGIDVSFAQKKIDWEKVSAAGVDFAMVRAGYRGYEGGLINEDEYFAANMTGAQKAGIETGVYFYSQAVNEAEAVEEAEFVLRCISGYNVTFPVAYDWETVTSDAARTDSITGDELDRCAIAFCRTIEENGYHPVIYASLNLLRDRFDKYTIDNISRYDLWLAEYKNYPEYPYQIKMWQYTDEGKIDGIDYPVDLNLYFE